MKILKLILFCCLVSLCSCSDKKKQSISEENPFRMENLIPWSIVGFDVKERSPEERIKMLKELGYKQYAYGHRSRHIPTMKQEWELAKENGVKIKAVWLYINLKKDKVGNLKPESEVVFKNLKATGLETQIWVGMDPKHFENLSNDEAMRKAIEMIDYLDQRAKSLNCKIALYNHGGWYGNPKNQLEIIKTLDKKDIGIVYNFHHAHDDLDNYSKNIKSILQYLWCVNLNGMKEEGPKIISIGKGEIEKEMIQELLDLGYQGPFGVLGHVKGGDPAIILKENTEGLNAIFSN